MRRTGSGSRISRSIDERRQALLLRDQDVFSNRIVGYSISDRMTAKLAVDAVRNAVARRGETAGCILHADRGSQFRSRAMARELRRHDMVGSMGRVGAAGDNAAMERCSYRCQVGVGVLSRSRKTWRA